jgi:hypothetical protein
MAKWSEVMAEGGSAAAQPMGAYDMETERMKKAIQDIIDDNKSRITQDRQDKLHGDPARNPFLDDDPCPTCLNGVCQCGPDEEDWLEDDDESTLGLRGVYVNEGYHDLFDVLRDALDQAQNGKGEERHGNGLSFTGQPALTITRAVGLGFPLGQAMKKIQESQRMDTDAAKRELLGAINYLAAAVLFLDESAD